MKQLLTKAVLVTLAVTSIGSTGGVAEAGGAARLPKQTTTTCDSTVTACPAMAAKGIRW